jgi:hypothetical protein
MPSPHKYKSRNIENRPSMKISENIVKNFAYQCSIYFVFSFIFYFSNNFKNINATIAIIQESVTSKNN